MDNDYNGIYSEENNYITIKNCDVNVGVNGTAVYLYNNMYLVDIHQHFY